MIWKMFTNTLKSSTCTSCIYNDETILNFNFLAPLPTTPHRLAWSLHNCILHICCITTRRDNKKKKRRLNSATPIRESVVSRRARCDALAKKKNYHSFSFSFDSPATTHYWLIRSLVREVVASALMLLYHSAVQHIISRCAYAHNKGTREKSDSFFFF